MPDAAPPTYEAWLDWVFTGPPPSSDDLWDEAAGRPAAWPLTYCTRLFGAPGFLRTAYSDAQVREGLWGLPNAWELPALLWPDELPWDDRKACIESMYTLFAELFALNDYDGTCYMWWDMLRWFDRTCDPRVPALMAQVLDRILRLPDEECQHAALHGLGHLPEAHRTAPLAAYLTRTQLAPEVRAYAERALAGKVL